MPCRDQLGLRMPAASAVLGTYVLRLGTVVLLAACRERGAFPTDVPDRVASEEIGAARRSVALDPAPTSCGTNCVLVPGDVPGTHSRPLSTGPNRFTAENSIVWPDTLPNATMMLMRVTGVIPRAYVGAMTPSFAYLQGTTYKPIDADGAFSGSFCFGEIRTNFRVFGFVEHTLRSCTLSNNNNDADNLIVAEKVTVGRLRGSGTVLRTGMNQPTWPGWFNCLNGPCVIAAEAQQTITMHPWMDKLALTATPTEVYEGDSVSFTPSVSGGMTLIAGSQRWRWVPHRRAIGGQVQTDPPDTKTGACANGIAICRVRVYRTGNMYLRANLNPATIGEQAFAKVVVKPLKLIAMPTPRAVGGNLDSVRVLVRTVPERTFSSIIIVPAPALTAFRRATLVGSAPMSAVCNATAGECELSGGVAPTSLTVTATTVQGVTLTTTVTVDTLPCPTKDSVLDSREMRALIDSLWKLGGNQGSAADRRERTAMLIDSSGVLVARILPVAPSATPCTTATATDSTLRFVPPSWIPGDMKILSVLHTHPFKPSEALPSNCPQEFQGRSAGTGPSPDDWGAMKSDRDALAVWFKNDTGVDLFSQEFKPLIIEPEKVWLMNPRSGIGFRQKSFNGRQVMMADTVVLGDNLQGWERKKPLSKTSCYALSKTPPSIIR